MRLADFDYTLPKELIAQHPLPERDTCRLLVVDRVKDTIEHRVFKDIGAYLRPADVLVVNDTRVLPCRLIGRRSTGGAVEAFLLKHSGGMRFEAMLKPGRLKLNERVIFGERLMGTVVGRESIVFDADDIADVYSCGTVPLPPYIKRRSNEADKEYYQTVYARCDGAVAAPTAGLHFSEALLAQLKKQGVMQAYVTLHVGVGTFKPVKAEDIRQHVMDAEWFSIPEETQALLTKARAARGRIIGVGTTSVRTLETYGRGAASGWTDIFMYPGYTFTMVDGLLTNFHLPKTTLLMLVCAFGGTALIKRAYAEAVAQKYRFYSYGDAMLIV
jgi:S-adenosylmethionine:tRNA ribosyltransferase-isomerase